MESHSTFKLAQILIGIYLELTELSLSTLGCGLLVTAVIVIVVDDGSQSRHVVIVFVFASISNFEDMGSFFQNSFMKLKRIFIFNDLDGGLGIYYGISNQVHGYLFKSKQCLSFFLVAATALGFKASTVDIASKVTEAEASCFATSQVFLHMTRESPFSITCSLIVCLCHAGTVEELEIENVIVID